MLGQTLGNWRSLVRAEHGTLFVHTDECVELKEKNWTVAVLASLGEGRKLNINIVTVSRLVMVKDQTVTSTLTQKVQIQMLSACD